MPKFHAQRGASLFAQAWENILRVKLGLSLTVGLEQGRPHLVLEGPFSTKFSSSPNENTSEPASQGLTRITRTFQEVLLELVVEKLYRTVVPPGQSLETPGLECPLFVLAMPVAGEHSLNRQSRPITCTIKTRN